MLKKRIIPCLDVKNGRTVKGVNFLGLRDAGCPVELAKTYAEKGADELVFLDITATLEGRRTFAQLVERIAKEINIPFTVGGGINSVSDAKILIEAGADKISVNSSVVKNPNLIAELANAFGSQCVVVAIDGKWVDDKFLVFVKGGTEATNLEVLTWALEAEKLGAGEILLTAMDSDGTKNGFNLYLTNLVADKLNIPVIASGGAGNLNHFAEVFSQTKASAALAASLFHFNEISVEQLKTFLNKNKIPVRV
jgi:cyclase